MDPSLLDLRVPGTPVPKARPKARIRYTTEGPKVQVYTPETTAEWEALIEAHARRAWGRRPPLEGRLIAHLEFDLVRPKSAKADYPMAARGDIDNFVKCGLDALQAAGVIKNDSQVTDLSAVKRYANEENGRPEGMLIRLWGDS